MILYRPVSMQELELIYDSGMKAFPARLPQQPIFYPVLDLAYARQIASGWNVKSRQFAGYVTEFKVEEDYISRFEEHPVRETQYQELWIPAEEMDEFNKHILGHIKLLEGYFGEGFQGFVPEKFGLQGKNAVAQFTLLANSYIYKRMDFYLEIKRNHKAIFLNYPFWGKHDFKNQGLKVKVLQAIKEAWLTSFPQTPLANPAPEEITPLKKNDSQISANSVQDDTPPVKQTNSQALSSPAREEITPVEQKESPLLDDPDHEDTTLAEQTDSHSSENSVQKGPTRIMQTESYFVRGVKLGLSGKYHEAIDALSKAVEEDPAHIVARTSLGVALHRLSEDERALSCYEAALRIDSKYAEAHYFRANILYDRGNLREAIPGYTIAIGLEPELIDAHEKNIPQGRLTDYTSFPAGMHRIARPAHRILDLDKALETNPRQAQLFKERAAQYARLWNYEQAIADYSSSLAIQPDDASALHFRGQAYEHVGQAERAQEDFQKATSIDPQLSDLYMNRGVTLGKMGNLRQSVTSLTEAIRLAPGNPDGYFNRGMTYLQLGDFERAIADFSMVIQLSSNDEAAYYWRGISHEEAGHQRQAINDYRQFLALSQDENAREEIEQKLSQWNADAGSRDVPDDGQKTNHVRPEPPGQDLDLYDLIVALGERAMNSTWSGSGVDCYGEKADELYSFTDHNRPIAGHDLLRITSGIRQTIAGDFQAFDSGAAAHWIFIRAWDGSGFYIETNDAQSRQRLKTHFQSIEEVEGASPPYVGLFIRI